MSNALRLSGVTLPGTGYPSLVNFIVPDFPVKTGLVSLVVAGGTEALSLMNRANAALPALKVGAPTINALGATLDRSNHFDSQIAGAAAVTLIAIGKMKKFASSAQGWMAISNYQNATPFGDSLALSYFSTYPALRAFAGVTGGTIASTIDVSAGVDGEWNAFAGRYTADAKAKAWWMRNGNQVAGVETAAGSRETSAAKFRFGGHLQASGGNFAETNDFLLGAIFTAGHSDSDMTANLAYLHNVYGPAIGITTL